MNNKTKLIVAAIVVLLLLGLAVVWMVPRQQQLNRTHATLTNARQAMDKFVADTGRVPPNLVALWEKPESGRRNGPSLTPDSLNDAWGHLIRYACTNGISELRSSGRDGLFGTKDDILNQRSTPNKMPQDTAHKLADPEH